MVQRSHEWVAIPFEGKYITVSQLDPIAYLVEIFRSPESTEPVVRECFTKLDRAWTYLDTELKRNNPTGIGHVVILNLTLLHRPERLRCLGRRDGPKRQAS